MIISIFSPKGGVGKTTITLALSKMASEKLKTCTVEFDFSPGDFVSILDIERKKNIFEAVHNNLDWAIQRPYKQNFDVIVGGYPDTYEMIRQEQLKSMMEELNRRYELVFVDIQPNFIEGCIDVFEMSKDILLIVEDNHSVNSRAIGNIDWARTNGFINPEKISFIINKMQGRELKYVNITELKFPILYKIPYIKGLDSFENKKMLRHAKNILNSLYPDIFKEEKRHFAIFKKNVSAVRSSKIAQNKITESAEETEQFETVYESIKQDRKPELEYEDFEVKSFNNPVQHEMLKSEQVEITEELSGFKKNEIAENRLHEDKTIINKEGSNEDMKVYVNTGFEELDNIFKDKLDTTDSLVSCDTAIISFIANKEFIKNLIAAGKRIILFTDDKNYELINTAKELGIKDIFLNSIDPEKIVELLNGEKVNEENKGDGLEMLLKKDFVENETVPVVIEPDKEKTEKVDYDEVSNIKDSADINDVLMQIKNILAKNKETYEERISKQEEIIREKDEEIKRLNLLKQEYEKTIEEYKRKEIERKQVFEQLQKLLQ